MPGSSLNKADDTKDQVGLTTTVPAEVLFAAGRRPVDLNNVFISDPDAANMVAEAEAAGFGRNVCTWIKGLYAALMRDDAPKTVIAVTQGDCSNTHALMEVLITRGLEVAPFDFPYDRDPKKLEREIERLISRFPTTWERAEEWKSRLDIIRAKLVELDELAWRRDLIHGRELHTWLVSASDFWGAPDRFEAELDVFLSRARARRPIQPAVRLGYLGVPPIMPDLFDTIEELGGRVVFTEVARQFAMPPRETDLVSQYLGYTYPYDVFGRIEDIAPQIERRGLDGLIHYTQSFCHRQIQDIVLRQRLGLPILTVEGDRVGPVDGRTRLRIESFIDILGS